MKVLIACEESQEVTKAFRQRGHEAFSCDLQECSGGHPEWHIRENCLPIIGGGVQFKTEDGKEHEIEGLWDLIIAHPPCTFLTVSGNRWFAERYGTQAKTRYHDRISAIELFMAFTFCSAKRIAIENPIGIMSSVYRKPDQIIQPWQFGHGETKATCLWLKNLPALVPTRIVEGREGRIFRMPPSKERSKLRSKTYPGIAEAMAEQWGTESTGEQNDHRCENCHHWISWDWHCHKDNRPVGPADSCGDWIQMDPERDLMQTFSP